MTIAVIGAGSWGTALAQVLAKNGSQVFLWARRESVARSIDSSHRNPDYLSSVELSTSIRASSDLEEVVRAAEAVVLVTPSKVMRSMACELSRLVGSSVPVVVCFKGVEENTGCLPLEVLEQEMGNAGRFAVLSGPNHAEEVAVGIPAGTVVASACAETADAFQRLFSVPQFRVYTSSDAVGVELCAAAKNVIAIAVGLSYGMGYGDNTASMLITRGMAEMSRLVSKAAGDPLTCMGLAGAGDLIATCMSRHSRNRRFGEAFARGTTLDRFHEETHMVVEGALACKNLSVLEQRYGIELPITDVVRGLIWEGLTIDEARDALNARSLKPEFYGI
ncbi:NAD(P)H-dependent glycerol-3-phosphate dehydrogenase [Gordonibacter sp. Marseille-P4307]|uniref:NAD(P)H-dependent glycerol-3-phosphate dehydrogenase n=1 Tax=Gordonibacter sp. Marseille-P4307 TaxID=2161815 RepID=UPI000F5358CA|nr:NAD(P)H-dependent glycerol-3-phosphate dehydrogenase [Gordonibacter sp. Marseille-P4307]